MGFSGRSQQTGGRRVTAFAARWLMDGSVPARGRRAWTWTRRSVVGIRLPVSPESGAGNNRLVRNRLLELAQARRIGPVLVTELSRWGRSTQELLNTLCKLAGWKVLTAVLAFGVLPAHAEGFDDQSAVVGPGVSLLSGVQACEPTLQDDLTEGSRCMAGWAVNHLLLDAATRLATSQGQALFGEHFRIVNTMSFSPFEDTVSGGVDVVLPLASATPPGAAPSETGAFFLQQGVTRWVD